MLQNNFMQQAGWNAQDKFPKVYKMFAVDDIAFDMWEVKGTFLPDAENDLQEIYGIFKGAIDKIYNRLLEVSHDAIEEIFK